MRLSISSLGMFVAAALSAADPVPAGESAARPPKLSSETSQRLTSVLPKYAPPPPVDAKPPNAPNPDVIELPKMTVTQKKRPRLTEEAMMSTKGFNEQLAKEKLTALDRSFLNRFTLPSWFGGQSAAERAREEHEREQRAQLVSDVNALAKVVEVEDPAKAKALRDAVAKP